MSVREAFSPADLTRRSLCRRGVPSVPARSGGGGATRRGAAAERGEEHPEERLEPPAGSAAAAAGSHARGQKAKVSTSASGESRIQFWGKEAELS